MRDLKKIMMEPVIPQNLIKYFSIGIILIACVVLFGWYSENIMFIQIVPGLAAMQYNTALGFLLFGFALLLLVNKIEILGKAFGFIGGLIGFLTLVQYLGSVNLGIDELLMEHYIDLEILYPGRMSPNTALCFSLSGFALLLSFKPFKKIQFSILLALIVSGMGVLALVGYLLNLRGTYGWSNLPQMALHTSIGFILLGFGIGIYIWLKEWKSWNGADHKKELQILVLTACFILIFLTIDLLMPLGVAAGVPYMLVLAMSWKLPTNKAPLNLAALISIMIVLGYMFSPPGAEGYIPILNRAYAFGAVWAAALLLYRLKIDASEMKSLNEEIERRNQELSKAQIALQYSNEEMAAFNEELTVANEELIDQQLALETLNDQMLQQSQLLRHGEKVAQLNTWTIDPKSNHVQYSPSYVELFEIDKNQGEEAMKIQKLAWIHPEDQAKMNEFYSQEFKELPISSEFRYLPPNGKQKWLRDTIAFKFDDGKLLGITQDITAAKKTQRKMEITNEQLYVATEELTATNEELISAHHLLSQANEDLAFFSQSLNKILSINTYHYPSYQKKVQAYLELGCELMDMEVAVISRIEGNTITIETCIPDGILFKKGHKTIVKEGEDNRILEIASTIFFPDFFNADIYHPLYGEFQPGAYIETPFWGIQSIEGTLHFSSENPQSDELIEKKKDIIALLSRKISNCIQQYEAKAAIEQANQELEGRVYARTKELEKTNSYLDNFVHATAHDLRSPVANLKQISNLMIMLQEEDDPILDKLSESVERLDRTVSGLIQIIDAQKIENEVTKSLIFSEKLEQIMGDFKNQIQQLDAKIDIDLQVKEIIYLEPYLDCIMRNVIQNALKYASPKRSPEISISTYLENEYIVLKIEDNGIGINLEEAGNRLFRAFKRFTEQASGSGLGLHLVKSMVDKNDGEVKVESTLGVGTTFFICLKPYSFHENCPMKESTLSMA